MNEDVIELLDRGFWTERRKFLLRVALFYFALGFSVATVIFWG